MGGSEDGVESRIEDSLLAMRRWLRDRGGRQACSRCEREGLHIGSLQSSPSRVLVSWTINRFSNLDDYRDISDTNFR
jgi:hypothetical protein